MNSWVIPFAIVSHPSHFGPFDSQSWEVHEAAAGRRLAPNPLPRRSNEQQSTATVGAILVRPNIESQESVI
ncbi:hypothetical protein BO83DRAFT_381460 [Aspergillus eucalypticola CBS 122712]|uniref:Uncharacterized protein n=1 Tax=Aspergillus eucalypticola (strain CBS 122712 / IBT 29274) TaxID=1448314 RepID=A0A317V013_ASPEC|nr:uncharacterized protein BO83DRAFT_381460 [Aspergillus eucalypticola CBS 122712]PWY65530.1 hypothetical protein BO83DRAFT_381460 [Aspergillus eucalypticola CBS 122712]